MIGPNIKCGKRNSYFRIQIAGINNRFVFKYIHNKEKFRVLDRQKLRRFLRYLFSLYNEQIVSTLLSIKEGFNKEQGYYITEIIKLIMEDATTCEKYEQLTEKFLDAGDHI